MCTTLVTLKTLKLANGICVRCCLRLPGVHSAVCSELKVLNYAPCNRKEHQVGVNVHTVLCTSVHQCAQCARVSWKCWGVLHINSLLLGRSAHSMTITMLAIMLMWWTLGEEKERNHLKLGFVWFSTQTIFLTRTNNEIHCNQKHIGVSRTKDTWFYKRGAPKQCLRWHWDRVGLYSHKQGKSCSIGQPYFNRNK